MMVWIYLMLLLIGFIYALVVGLGGGVFGDAHHGGDFGGHGGDIGQHDAGGHGDAAAADSGEVQFSPFSPVVIATFVGAFGATGLICIKLLHLPLLIHLPCSLGSGVAIGAAVYLMFRKLFSVTQSSSQPRTAEIIGVEAEVLTAIPEGGLGQIAYTARGSRFTASARAESGKRIETAKPVVITKVVGGVCFVDPASDVNLRKRY